MKFFSLISLAAILSHLTLAIAISAHKCGDKVLGPATIQEVINKAFAAHQKQPPTGPANQDFFRASFSITMLFPSEKATVEFELGTNSKKEVVYLKAFFNGVTFPCTPTTEAPDINGLQS
ncbi:putative candidate secreted effector protein [Blumeria hordei DH14]|uniref:Putative candidate secreted effector protein n=1 Tax=Blumeria graminis f. sp. hordei (strain DH14) TaxID=546991 RepID=N1JHF8_BLUG1|nr:putative candidate secreted effector protein [Blumeria hordei DH14]